MPCNDGGDARRPVGRERQKADERTGKRKRITVLYLLAEMKPPQLQNRIPLLLSILFSYCSYMPYYYRNINSFLPFSFARVSIYKYLNIIVQYFLNVINSNL